MSSKVFRVSAAMVLGLILLTQFNNCGGYTTAANSESSSLTVACASSSCITPTVDNLKTKVNLGGGSDYQVTVSQVDWNLGGDCNEGGYPYNIIVWELYLNGAKVRDSNYLGMLSASPNSTLNVSCVNGRFSIYISLAAISQDPINRTGLMTGAGLIRAPYDLYIEIYGRDTPAGPLNRNPLKGRTHVSLIPST